MGYLISKIIICLLLAFLLGLIIGWLLRNLFCRSREQALIADAEGHLGTLRAIERDRDDIGMKLQGMERDNVDLNAKILSLANQGDQFSAEREQLKTEFSQASADLDRLTAERDTALKEKDQLTNEHGRIIGERDELTGKLDELTAAKNSADQENTRLAQERDRIAGEKDQLTSNSARLAEEKQQAEDDRDLFKEKAYDVEAAASSRGVGDTVDVKGDYEVEEIEGIGKGYGGRLRKMGIATTMQLLEKGINPATLTEIAKKVGIEEFVVRSWISMADLIRVPGIRGQFGELMEASGIKTVQQLAAENTAALTSKMAEVNAKEHRTRTDPTTEMVGDWIKGAQKLSRIIPD